MNFSSTFLHENAVTVMCWWFNIPKLIPYNVNVTIALLYFIPAYTVMAAFSGFIPFNCIDCL